jgi:proline dehydrogenase
MLVLKMHLPLKKVIKKTIFNHFCGGETLDECKKTFQTLSKYNIFAMPEYSVEGESTIKGFENYKNDSIEIINYLGKLKLPFIAIKFSGLASLETLEKVSNGEMTYSSLEYKNFYNRVNELCECAMNNNVKILIDAEESWIQKAIDDTAFNLMKKYNIKTVNIFLTYQCYKIHTLKNIEENYKISLSNNYKLGVKLVRGAYMEKERSRAKKFNYSSPIHVFKKETDNEFDDSVEYCINKIDHISLWIGSHNEISCIKLMELLNSKKLSKNDERVWFSQLYGMSDNISFTLASLGYNVIKLIPFGPIEKTIPYLIRRANENSSVKGQSNRQYTLIKNEINRRKDLN